MSERDELHRAAPSEALVGDDVEDATVVVAIDDATVVAIDDATVVAPVVESNEISPGLAKLFFKKPLDPRRRAPEAPFPKSQSSLPRAGVGAGIPVVYGARAEGLPAQPAETELSRMIGPPPLGYELPLAEREALPSTARLNRKFRVIALGGGLGMLAGSTVGLWWVVTLLLRS